MVYFISESPLLTLAAGCEKLSVVTSTIRLESPEFAALGFLRLERTLLFTSLRRFFGALPL